MIAFLFIPFIFLLFYTLGTGVVEVLKLKVKHTTLYGFIALFIPLAVVMSGSAVVHVSWTVFSVLFALVLVFAVIAGGFSVYKYKLWQRVNVAGVWRYVKSNWFMLALIAVIILLVFTDMGTIFWSRTTGGTWDDYLYGAKALKAIGSPAIFATSPSIAGTELTLHELIPAWELFTAFFSNSLGVAPAFFNRMILPFMVVSLCMFGFSEFLYQLSGNKESKYHSLWLVGIASLVVIDYAYEFHKLLATPWFGNVILTCLYLPVVFALFFQALKNYKAFWLWILLPVAFMAFSSTMLLYSAIVYLVLVVVWFFLRQEKGKLDWLWMGGIVLVCLGALGFLVITLHVPWETIRVESYSTEQIFYVTNIRSKVPMLTAIIILFFYRLAKKNVSRNEMVLFIFVMSFLVVTAFVPVIRTVIFNLFSFPLRRFMESMLLLCMAYFGYILMDTVFQYMKKQYVLIAGILLFIFYRSPFSLPINAERYNIKALTYENKMADTVTEISQLFDTKNERLDFVVVSSEVENPNLDVESNDTFNRNNLFPSTYYERFVDIGDNLLALNKNAYFAYPMGSIGSPSKAIENVDPTAVDAIITDSAEFKNQLLEKFSQSAEIHEIMNTELKTPVYVIFLN